MKKLNILNTREVKKIREKCIDAFGCFLKKDYAFLESEKGRIFVVNRDISKIDLDKLKIDKMGLYFAEDNNKCFRLSKEGAQLLVKEVKEVEGAKEIKEVRKAKEVEGAKEIKEIRKAKEVEGTKEIKEIRKAKEANEVRNLVELNKEEVETYFKGEDLDKDLGEESKLIILKYENHVLGCTRYKENKILNFLPKIHRGTVIV